MTSLDLLILALQWCALVWVLFYGPFTFTLLVRCATANGLYLVTVTDFWTAISLALLIVKGLPS